MTKKTSRLAEALIETADDMLRLGIMNKTTHEKITLRHLVRRHSVLPSRSAARKFARCENRRT
jgi:hypothetical protein